MKLSPEVIDRSALTFIYLFFHLNHFFHNNHISSSACLVKNVIPNSLSPPGTVPWQPAREAFQQGPPSPSSISSSGSTSPGYSPSRTLDLSGSSTSFSSERKNAHHWQNGPVQEWTKEQVINK